MSEGPKQLEELKLGAKVEIDIDNPTWFVLGEETRKQLTEKVKGDDQVIFPSIILYPVGQEEKAKKHMNSINKHLSSSDVTAGVGFLPGTDVITNSSIFFTVPLETKPEDQKTLVRELVDGGNRLIRREFMATSKPPSFIPKLEI